MTLLAMSVNPGYYKVIIDPPHLPRSVSLCIPSPSVTPYKGPRNLQTSEPTKTSFRVTWDHAPGDVKGYKVTYHPVEDDINLGQLLVGPYDNTVVLEELRFVPLSVFLRFIIRLVWTFLFSCIFCNESCFWVYRAGTKYTVSVFGMFEGGESMPLAGEEYTTYSDAPDPPIFDTPSNITHIYVMYIAHGHCKNERRTCRAGSGETNEIVLVILLLYLSLCLSQRLQYVLFLCQTLESVSHITFLFGEKPLCKSKPHKS